MIHSAVMDSLSGVIGGDVSGLDKAAAKAEGIVGRLTGGVNSQAAALAALTGPMEFLDERNEIFRARRDLCLQALNQIDGLSCVRPNGAFYLFPSCAGMIGRKRPDGRVIANDSDFVMYLVEEAGVAAVPGSAFGLAPYFRISFAIDTDRLREACARIRAACAKLTD